MIFRTLPVLLVANLALAAGVSLSWDPSPDPAVVGYNLYFGPGSRTYTNFVPAGNVTSIAITNLADDGIYYFAATAYDTKGLESDFSNEVSYNVPAAASAPPLVQLYALGPDGITVLVGNAPVSP